MSRRLTFRLRPLLTALLLVLLGYLVGTGQRVVVRPPLVVGQDATYPGARAVATLERAPQPFLDIRPVGRETNTLLIFYPGGFVRPQAYEWLGTALAGRGVRTVIPVFPLDLAFTGTNRADALIDRLGAGRRVVLAGHSLGGAAAAGYAARHAGRLSGLILMGAYPAGNVSLRDSDLRVLSLLAGRDGVADAGEVRGGLARLPPDTRLVVLPGAVHSSFGRYGPQRGDGRPTVPRAVTEAQIVRAVLEFIAEP